MWFGWPLGIPQSFHIAGNSKRYTASLALHVMFATVLDDGEVREVKVSVETTATKGVEALAGDGETQKQQYG